ncbi:MAG: hypothetical protein V3U63_00395 [Gemmatimonadota bacterium]
MVSWLERGGKPFLDRWLEKIESAAERAASSMERTGDRATETAERIRRKAGSGLSGARSRARERAGAGRDAVSERVDAIARRAAELRGDFTTQRHARAARRRYRRMRQEPLVMDVRDDDRITLRGRRPVDIQTPDGGVIRYRYYEHPSLALRIYLHSTGRQVWPPR